MKQIQLLNKSESGVIHHLGLFILGAVMLAGVGFAVFTVVQNNNKGSDSSVVIEVDESEEATQGEVSEDDFKKDVDTAQAEADATEEVKMENL